MYKNKSFIAIIPARSGSKGLPDKNIKDLLGKPLLSWSVDVALECKYIDEVIVSTDSVHYAEIAKSYGANVPFIRPAEFATDTASRKDVIKHALDFFTAQGKSFDYVVFLEPTSPLRTVDDLNAAIVELIDNHNGAEAIVGVSMLESFHPAFLIKLKNGFLDFLEDAQKSTVLRRQDLEKFYFYEGSLYISEVDKYLQKEFYHDKTLGYVVPRWKSLEIDEIEDFIMIEALMKYKGYKNDLSR
jgi:N-acylneuraminate cytidylyltransferase/CMP-N,N'-diacetyllegionaminic acid synthase